MAAMAATAAQAGMAAQVVAGGIGSSALADQSVTTAKLASNAVTSAQIQAGSIQVANLSGSLLNNTFWKLGGNSGTTSSNYLGTSDNRPLELRVNGGSVLRLQASPSSSGYSGGFNIINGSPANYISPTAFGATIAGGGAVMYNSSSSASNLVANDFGTVGGGQGNVTYGFAGTIAGGYGNNCGSYSCVGGGYGNQANGLWSTIPGGYACQANGYASFAAGYEAIANHEGTFVWADDNAGAFTSTAPYQFLIRASGGVGINTPSPSARLHVSGLSANDQVIVRLEGSHPQGAWLDLAGTGSGGRVWDLISTASGNSEGAGKLLFRQASVGVVMTLSPNGFVGIGNVSPTNRLMVQNARCDGSTWINASDRNLKENFHQIDADRVLEKVCALPISQWNYKGDSGAAHMGPVAQDFHAEFGLGSDDKSIATVDESGVALAAIQGLNRKLETQLREEDAQILLLERKVEKLQQMEITVRKLQALLPAQ